MVVDSAEEEIVEMPVAKLTSPISPIDHPPLITTSLSPPWPMVSISKYQNNNNPPIIFPPANHENLSICPDPPPHIHIDLYSSSDSGLVSDSDSNSSSTFSPFASNSPLFSSPKASPGADVSRRFESWTEILRSKFYSAMLYLWTDIISSKSVLLTFRSAASTAVVVLGFLYFRQRRRLRAGEHSRGRLTRIIDEKEEKINQLLDQVSRMNQVLLALHKAPTFT